MADGPIDALTKNLEGSVMIVDDNPSNIGLIESHLKEWGLTTYVATSGELALKRIAYAVPDIILLDILMPGLSGYEVCERIKSMESVAKIPVIFMTALKNTDEKIKGFNVGAVDFITKPIHKDELFVRIRSHLRIHKYNEMLEHEVMERTNEIKEHMRSLESEIQRRKETELALKASEERFRTLYNNSPDMYLSITPDDYRIRLCNETLLKVTGYEYDSLMGRSIDFFFDEESVLYLRRALSRFVEVHISPEEKLSMRTSDGKHIYVNLNLGTVREDSDTLHIIISLRDITHQTLIEEEKKRLQDQLNHKSKLDAIGELASGIAHDFNNILAGIMSSTELLESLGCAEEENNKKKYTSLILESSKKAAALTSKLLTFGRQENPTSGPVDIHRLIEESTEILQRTVNVNIVIQKSLYAGDHIIAGEESSLQNVLMNLCINASHAIVDRGEIHIKTENRHLNQAYCDKSPFEVQPGPYCLIEIRDTGSGIAEENLTKIFEPFYTTKEKGKGTGLGLSIVYGIIKNHKGIIEVSSVLGEGTVFRIFLPTTVDVPEAKDSEQEIEEGSGTILLVEDDPTLGITGTDMLKYLKYNVLLAENGEEALKIFRAKRNEIDLVILDQSLPILSGKEVFYEMKKINSSCKVLLTSGNINEEDLKGMQENGLNDFIPKPYTLLELSHKLAAIMGS